MDYPKLLVIYKDIRYRLFSFICKKVKNRQDAEDIFQELWLHVINNFDDNQINSTGLSFFKCNQLIINYYKKNNKNIIRNCENINFLIEEIESNNDNIYLNQEERKNKFFTQYVNCEITEMEKEILWAKGALNFKLREISEKYQIPQSTIHDIKNKALTKIRKSIK